MSREHDIRAELAAISSRRNPRGGRISGTAAASLTRRERELRSELREIMGEPEPGFSDVRRISAVTSALTRERERSERERVAAEIAASIDIYTGRAR